MAEVLPLELGLPGLPVAVSGSRSPHLVAAGVPGDRLRVRPTSRLLEVNLAESVDAGGEAEPLAARLAEVRDVLAPADERCLSPCPVVRQCGGCALQEMEYGAQLRAKRTALVKALAPLGQVEERLPEIPRMSKPFGYRTSLLMVSGGRAGALRFGFYRRGTTELVPAEGCAVQHPLTLSTLAMMRQVLDGSAVAPSERGSSAGWLHAVRVRASPATGLAEVTLVVRSPRAPGKGTFVEQLARLPGVHSLNLCVAEARSSYPITDDVRRLAGARRTPFHIGAQRFALSPATFFQTNAEGAERLAEAVLASLPPHVRCLGDLYGGAGVFAQLARGRYGRAIVGEESASALADLRHALKREPAPITVAGGRVEQTISRIAKNKLDAVIVDPPRRGCHPQVLRALGESGPRHIVYVACGIESLVRDGAALRAFGYDLAEVRAVDMFPHTTHLETVACFVRAGRARA